MIDYKITGVISKVLGRNLQIEDLGNEEISEEEISQIVRKVCLSASLMYPENLDETGILKEIIVITGRDEILSKNIFKGLKRMRLGLFEKEDSFGKFDVLSFAIAKKIITSEERGEIFEKRREE